MAGGKELEMQLEKEAKAFQTIQKGELGARVLVACYLSLLLLALPFEEKWFGPRLCTSQYVA